MGSGQNDFGAAGTDARESAALIDVESRELVGEAQEPGAGHGAGAGRLTGSPEFAERSWGSGGGNGKVDLALGDLATQPSDFLPDVGAHLVEFGFRGRVVLKKFAGET